MGDILHQLDGLTSVIWVIYYSNGRTRHLPYQNWLPTLSELVVTQSQVPPHVLIHTKLITCVPINGYLCVYDHSLFMKIFKKFLNMGHILHGLTGVI